jgi:CheY-like chemotaxis protein
MPTRRTVLVADDCSDDAFFLKRGFINAGIDVPVEFVSSGPTAMDYLTGKEHFGDRSTHPFPRLLVLDVKMPGMDGFGVLRWLRGQPQLKRLPVCMFSSSSEMQDVNLAYDLGANSYLVKPVSLDGFSRVAELLNSYWLQTNIPPEFAFAR